MTVWFSPPVVSPRAAWRALRTTQASRVVPPAIAHSTGRPTRKWSRRARPSCAILSPRRAAHLQRYTDGERKTSDRFSSGQVEASCRSSWRLAASPGSGNSRPLGPLRRFDLGRGSERRRKHQAASSSAGCRIRSASGARYRALLGSGASSVCGWRASGPRSFEARGCPTIVLVSSVGPFVIVSSVRSSSPVRRSCGWFETSWHSRAFWCGDRSFEGPYNNALEPTADTHHY